MLANPLTPFASLWNDRALILQLSKREISARYRGSLIGGSWALINPLLMLAVYTFVFGVIFRSRWSGTSSDNGTIEFAVVLFAGLLVFNIFAECISRAPTLVLSQTSYVKKVVFPLHILPAVAICNSLFHAAISSLVLFCGALYTYKAVSMTIIFFPLTLLPLLLVTLGISWFLASLGVYVRDVANIVAIVISIVMFLSPIFYPLTAVPQSVQPLLRLNPLSYVIEEARRTFLWGQLPRWDLFTLYTAGGMLICWLGFIWFQKTRKGFADVL